MHRSTLAWLALVALAGCSDPAQSDQEAHRVTEQRMEQLIEVARDLRDRDPQMRAPEKDAFFAAARARYPSSQGAEDMLLDAWGHPFDYERASAESAQGPQQIIKLWSVGPNGVFEDSKGDDVLRTTTTTIHR